MYSVQVPACLWRLGIVLKKKKEGLWCSSSVNVLKVERINFNEYIIPLLVFRDAKR
jgi:hypothetical protein